MSQTALITYGEQPLNQAICRHLLSKGYRVLLVYNRQASVNAQHFEEDASLVQFKQSLSDEQRERFFAKILQTCTGMQSFGEQLTKLLEPFDALDVLIHGDEGVDELASYDQIGSDFNTLITHYFEQLFYWNHHVSIAMAKQRKGKIIFPLIADSLYALGYPSAPVRNHGKISMMKSLAKECAPFNISVNCLTFGYYEQTDEPAAKKQLKKSLEAFVLKPTLPKLEQLVPSIDMLLNQENNNFSGQNLHIGAGISTSI